MAVVENGSSQETNDRSRLMELHQFQGPIHSQAHFSAEQNDHHHNQQRSAMGNERDEGFKREMKELEEMFSKLNPMAQEFVPPSLATSNNMTMKINSRYYAENMAAANFMYLNGFTNDNGNMGRRGKKNDYNQNKKRMSSRTGMAQREDVIRRTVYVSDIDHQITEEQLAAIFLGCGQVVDCRVCGDPNSVLRFAFVEFTDEEAAQAALSLSGTMLGYYPVKVLPSKTAIAPVNPTLLPQTEDEREMCVRTVYVANIDKKVSQADVKLFFETICGEVYRLRLLGDYRHSTHIAFVEFAMKLEIIEHSNDSQAAMKLIGSSIAAVFLVTIVAESAIAALNCSGVILGSLPIRVSPSKTPVRPRAPRPSAR
ncbi:hypothetical protein DH2020_043741 [Rehmannia glutinosa]|uniref:RRM domain-containing protein n=1 Tax=Rehmannia glutinosa TaxID=99300 RepID=A0ABR0UIS4_REHGL